MFQPVPYTEANVHERQFMYECEFMGDPDPARRQEILVAAVRALCTTLAQQSTREVMPEAAGLMMIMQGVAHILAGNQALAFPARELIKYGVSYLPFVLRPETASDPI